jgi:hypothetical protein
MEEIKNILSHFDLIEAFVIKTTLLISVILFCLFYIWNHIKEFRRKDKNNKKREQSINE